MSTASLHLPEYISSGQSLDVRIGTLQFELQGYDYPDYQREKVWTYPMKRSLIDSIFRAFPIPPIYVLRKDHRLWILDGQQRFSTIVEFRADGFSTARLREDPDLEVIEPNKRYSQLSSRVKEDFDNYSLKIWVVEERDEPNLGTLFRRLQQQHPLSQAERLWSYRSEARQRIGELIEHPFWQEIYVGKLTRKRPFLAALYLLLVELDHGYTNITPARLCDVATGAREGSLRPEMISMISKRLDDVRHLFHGSLILPVSEVIPLYQAVLFLEQAECDAKKSEQSCLSPWYTQVKEASRKARQAVGQVDVLAKITRSKYQIEFWSQEMPNMLAAKGLYKINKKRAFSAADRMQAWERQNGSCPVCRQPVKPTDQGHHIIHFKNGGPTNADNCMLVHEECHKTLHELGVEMEIIQVEDEAV